MVFESLVASLLNKFLGDYVQNFDSSQLKLGIWGGDVTLKHLDVKESALDDLDLPIKVVSGHLGKLILKIPYKNIYTAPTIATIEGLFVVVVPNTGIKYDAEKESKAAEAAKKTELQKLEEAKSKLSEKGDSKDDKKDTFTEKLVTQIIKTCNYGKIIATSNFIPDGVKYMLGPINSKAQLRLNSKPEGDGSGFKIPKVWLNVVMEEIAVGLSRLQYQDLIKLLESLDRMTIASLYRKYRPDVPKTGHAKEWWKFALNAILEEDVLKKTKELVMGPYEASFRFL
ncbi:vacuolar protein sorting-associated protein 13C [Caerostris extrusa]|uniref:Vacuolar protein sorting-associated protein 13C n=1 Tax=Caerostris extrusa TaxID=172846 RepID=A0AAV4M8H4_CAEEX|nr:vacuolar protein sorting-associated protein 13C [Caerostris extrusa]